MADNPWKKHCFVSAARHPLDIMASAPGMKKLKPIMSVVHCCLRGDNDDEWFPHAWIEVGPNVVDRSWADDPTKPLRFPAEDWYAHWNVDEATCRRYTVDEAAALRKETGEGGPWGEPMPCEAD